MHLKIKKLQFIAGRPVCIIHEKTAKEMSLHLGHRASIEKNNKKIISIIDITSGILKPDEIAVSEEISKELNLKPRQKVNVEVTERPMSIFLIKKKLKGEPLEKHEMQEIIKNIANNSLTEVEIAFFVSAVYTRGMSLTETKYLIQAMVETGNRIKLKGKVADKHSIGGIAGNRTTPIIVSICAAAGLTIPKTSSRAITSAAGTADVIETIAKVDFPVKEIEKIIRKINACFVWGGALGLAPVDDKIIKIEKIVKIDSPAQVLASILSKKISVGSKYILIDIPYGKSAKVTKSKAQELKNNFLKLGKIFKLKLKVVLTKENGPIGNGIGPNLEIKDVIKVLKREDYPKDLEEKSIFLSGELLELAGKAKKGQGQKLAQKILDSKQALKKFEQIIQAQKGDLGKVNKLKEPKFSYTICAKKKLKIKNIDNKLINKLARTAGCPEDKSAGVYLHKKKGQEAKKSQPLLTIYAVSKEKLGYAKKFFKENKKEILKVV